MVAGDGFALKSGVALVESLVASPETRRNVPGRSCSRIQFSGLRCERSKVEVESTYDSFGGLVIIRRTLEWPTI